MLNPSVPSVPAACSVYSRPSFKTPHTTPPPPRVAGNPRPRPGAAASSTSRYFGAPLRGGSRLPSRPPGRTMRVL
jgi:hypothetical protein